MAAGTQLRSLWQRFQERMHALASGEPQATAGSVVSAWMELRLALKAGGSSPRAEWEVFERQVCAGACLLPRTLACTHLQAPAAPAAPCRQRCAAPTPLQPQPARKLSCVLQRWQRWTRLLG